MVSDWWAEDIWRPQNFRLPGADLLLSSKLWPKDQSHEDGFSTTIKHLPNRVYRRPLHDGIFQLPDKLGEWARRSLAGQGWPKTMPSSALLAHGVRPQLCLTMGFSGSRKKILQEPQRHADTYAGKVRCGK